MESNASDFRNLLNPSLVSSSGSIGGCYASDPWDNIANSKFQTLKDIANGKDATSSVCLRRGLCYQNDTLPDDLKPLAECLMQPDFAWGFSSLLLYVVCSLQAVWTIGMFIVWVDANIYSQLCRRGRKTRGSLRAAIDIAEAMREVLGDELCAYTNAEIGHELEKTKYGVRYYASDTKIDGISHIGLSSTKWGEFSLADTSTYGGAGTDPAKN